tara:strand:+ start:2367 stop:2852 length:486 start_codon:yes stop_codon:yes gene_type:complete
MNNVFLQLGSNMGNRIELLSKAEEKIHNDVGRIIKKSKIYESTPWKVDGQSNYLNQVIKIDTELDPLNLLRKILLIENDLGRKRLEKWGERLIDIDILFYNDSILETPNLCIPHKHLHERNFVLIPFNDIDAEWIHPKINKSISQLLTDCSDNSNVYEFEI